MALFLVSCLPTEKGALDFAFRGVNTLVDREAQELRQRELWLKKLQADYRRDLQELEVEAKESFSKIKPIIKKKCIDCHDSREKLPIYGRIFPGINPVKKHQDEGLEALDFKETFPLMAKGKPSQLSLLKAIRASVNDRTMPLKSYLIVYPWRRITKKDAPKLLAWVNPLIEEYERLEIKYTPLFEANTPRGKVERIVQAKCLRCHGNGVARGGLGGFENLEKLSKDKALFNLEEPSKSLFYTVCETGEMPKDPRERLNQEELDALLEWIGTLKQ